jgi:hypothetical protein
MLVVQINLIWLLYVMIGDDYFEMRGSEMREVKHFPWVEDDVE